MPLVEREPQLDALHEYAVDAARGDGRLVLVSGEAGVGKSVLLEELEQRTADARWSWGACDSLFTPRPLGPLLDIAATLGGGVQDALAAGAPREDIFQALLAALADCTPYAVLVVEDAHWADEATLDLLRFVGRRIRRTPVLIAVTYRDDEVPPGHPLRRCLAHLSAERSTRRIDVPRLTPTGVRTLARGSGLAPDVLHHLTDGNPYFLTELLRSTMPGDLPTSARDAVLGRVEGLSRPARRALESSALLGAKLDLGLLQQLVPTTSESLDELVHSGLLVAEGADLRFRHEIARLAVQETVPPHRSAPVHAQALALLEKQGGVDESRLAHHAEGAADAAAVVRHATRAGDRATALASHCEAALQFERALRWAGAGDPRNRAVLNDSLATEYGLLDRWEDALQAREAALELWRAVGDRLREGDSLRNLSNAHYRLCRGAESERAAEASLDLLRPLGPTRELAHALQSCAGVHMLNGRDDDAVAAADEAIALAEDLGFAEVVSQAMITRASARMNAGLPWRPDMERALAVALPAGAHQAAARAYANLQSGAITEYDLQRAEQWYRDGMEFTEGHDLNTYANCLVGAQTGLLEVAGRWDECVELSETRMARPDLSPVNRLCTIYTLALVRARRGDPEAAWPLLDQALVLGIDLAEPQYLAPIHSARAEAFWLVGDLDSARTEASAAVAHATLVDPWMRGLVSTWARRTGLSVCPGRVGEPFRTQLSGDVTAAVAAWDERGCPYEAALALADSAEQEHWCEAVERLDVLRAVATAAVLRRRLREAGVRVPSGVRATTRAHPAGLTQREHEVLVELAAGLTNDEIATRLFISPKTVDHHVSAVLAKLGVTNRKDASTEAARLGLLAQPGEPVAAT